MCFRDADIDPARTLNGVITTILSRATDRFDAEALELLSELHDLDISAWHSYHETGAQISVPNEDVSFGFEVLSSS